MLVSAIGAVVAPLRAARADSGRLSLTVLILVPAIAAGFYAGLGTPGAATRDVPQHHQNQDRMDTAAASRTKKIVGSVASMLDGLRTRLEREPNDAGGWLLLAKSYQHLRQTENAIAAYERARALGKTDAAFEQSMTNMEPAAEPASTDTGPALRGRITLSADAADLVRPGDTVFIFAKESPEHRMPVVAVRKPATELPIQFALTDRDAMVSGTSLAQFEQLVVTAKISRSGLATDVLAGLEAWSDPVSPLDGDNIELQLSANPQADSENTGDDNE